MSTIVANFAGQRRGRRHRSAALGRSVFVDESGRRRGSVRVLMLAVAVLSLAPLVAVLLSVVGGVSLPPLGNPGVTAPGRQASPMRAVSRTSPADLAVHPVGAHPSSAR